MQGLRHPLEVRQECDHEDGQEEAEEQGKRIHPHRDQDFSGPLKCCFMQRKKLQQKEIY